MAQQFSRIHWKQVYKHSVLISQFRAERKKEKFIVFVWHREQVVKTRLQLQGELKKLDPNLKIYRGVVHGLYQVGRYDGVKALQKGLVPAFGFQFCLNSVR